jgi:iron complex outermembrane receptor protein
MFGFLSGLAWPATLAAQTAPAPAGTARDQGKEEAVQLSIFTVTEGRDIGYESMHTTSGMRTVQELKNVANSISVMNAQFMEDVGATNMEEMSRWFVTGEQNPDPALPEKGVFRGIVNNFAVRNGWIWYSPMDSYATDRVELLRGPNAFLYGEADLGGANNQITKRGLFTRNHNRAKLMLSSFDLLRGELDFNRILIPRKLAVRLAGVQSTNRSWIDFVRREFRGIYGALTYRPLPKTVISLMVEHAKSTSVNSQGLFLDQFSRTATTNVAAAGGHVYVPATKALFRSLGPGRVNSTGTGSTIIDPAIIRKEWQFNGPNATAKNYYDTFTLEAEQHLGQNLHLQISGNYYIQDTDAWGTSGRNIYRDRNPTLPNGTPNPYFNELYLEFFRTRQRHGGIVRDLRLSAVYDLKLQWMKQQIAVNLQQHQDTPGHWKPTWGEYLDPKNSAFVGAITPLVQTTAQYTANRTTFINNRFMRRYYLKDGNGAPLTGELGPIPGISAWYPDLGNAVPAGGEQTYRRFYTPSVGFGAAGSYFSNHLYTLVGFRRDHFNMKTRFGAPRPLENTWIVDEIPSLNAASPFVQYKVDGTNLGMVLRFNETFALAFNKAQSFRISLGEGNNTFVVGDSGVALKQSIPTGEGEDMSARLSLFQGRLEATLTRYKNFQPNDRISPAPPVQVRDEVQTIFPTTFLATGADYQSKTTTGYELEIVANLTRNWRLGANAATNEVVSTDRLPLLKGFQAEAKSLNQPTPLLDAFLLTFPDGVPNAGYTKSRANLFTRYTFTQGRLKGFYVGGGGNWRTETFRGNVDLNLDGIAEALWSPSYTVVSLLCGYTTRLANRPTTFALNADNLLNQDYYRSATNTSGSWGEPRSFRLTITTEF